MPAAIELGVALLAFAAMLFAYAALKGYQFSFKPILIQLGQIFNAIHLPGSFPFVGGAHIFGGLGDWLINTAEQIEAILAGFYLTAEGGVSYLFDQLAKQARWLGQELASLADTTDKAIGRLIADSPPVTIVKKTVVTARNLPHLARVALQPAIAQLRASIAGVSGEVATVESELEHLARGIDRTAKQLGGRISKTGASYAAAAGGLAGSIGLTWTWIQRLRHILTKSGAAALVGTALATLGLGFLRCPRFTRAGKQVCGMDANLLESLLADALLIAGTLSLVEFAHEMVGVTGEAVKPIQRFWRAG